MTRHSEPLEIIQLERPSLQLHFFSDLQATADWALGGKNRSRHRGVLIAANAEKLVKLYRSPSLFAECQAPIFYPDGVGALLFSGGKGVRLPGVELWLHVLEGAFHRQWKVSVYGAASDVASRTENLLRTRYQGLDICVYDGFQSEEVYSSDLVCRCPEVVFVALGSPRQELLIAELQKIHEGALYMGLGGSLDILTGKKRRAPLIFRTLGAEFAFRLLKEPTRLFRQTALVTFLWLLWRKKFGGHALSGLELSAEMLDQSLEIIGGNFDDHQEG